MNQWSSSSPPNQGPRSRSWNNDKRQTTSSSLLLCSHGGPNSKFGLHSSSIILCHQRPPETKGAARITTINCKLFDETIHFVLYVQDKDTWYDMTRLCFGCASFLQIIYWVGSYVASLRSVLFCECERKNQEEVVDIRLFRAESKHTHTPLDLSNRFTLVQYPRLACVSVGMSGEARSSGYFIPFLLDFRHEMS